MKPLRALFAVLLMPLVSVAEEWRPVEEFTFIDVLGNGCQVDISESGMIQVWLCDFDRTRSDPKVLEQRCTFHRSEVVRWKASRYNSMVRVSLAMATEIRMRYAGEKEWTTLFADHVDIRSASTGRARNGAQKLLGK